MYAEVPEKNVDSFMDRIEEGNIIMTPAAPLTPSSNLAGNSSNPSASVGVSPEGRTPVPVLSSPLLSQSQRSLVEWPLKLNQNLSVFYSKTKRRTQPKIHCLIQLMMAWLIKGGEDLADETADSVSEKIVQKNIVEKDELTLSDEKNNAKRFEPSVPVIAPVSAGKKGRKK